MTLKEKIAEVKPEALNEVYGGCKHLTCRMHSGIKRIQKIMDLFTTKLQVKLFQENFESGGNEND